MINVIKLTKEDLRKIFALLILFIVGSVFIITPLLTTSTNLKNYRGNGPLYSTNIGEMYKHPSMSIKYIVSNPSKILTLFKIDAILIVVTLVLVNIFKNVYTDSNGIKYRENDGTYGTAQWMHPTEAKQTIDVGKPSPGITYGTIPGTKERVKLPLDSHIYNKNVAVFGGPGSGKSRDYVRNNVFELVNARQSIIFTDPKGELFRDMYVYLKDQGYNVKVFNLVNLLNSDRWNPLTEVTDDLSAQLFTEVVMANTTAPGAKGDQFWAKGEQNLLKALLLYVVNELPEEERNLKNMYALIAHTDAQQLDAMFKILPNEHPAKAPYNIFCQASDTVRTGIIIGLGTRLQIIQNKKVQELTSTNDIDLTAPGKEPCAYFCITSDTNSTFDFLSGLFFSFLFIDLINYADLHNGECNPNVHCLLDEFANIAAIPDFTKKISTMRSRGIHTHVIFQNIGQLQNRYPNNGWSEIIGDCDSKLFLGCTDLLTAQFVSELLGTTTVEDVGLTKQAGFEGLFEFGRESHKGTKRNLLNPDEVLAYPYKNAILMLKGQKPLKLDKLDYSNYKESKELQVIQISDYNPQWAIDFTNKNQPKVKNQNNNINDDINNKKSDNQTTTSKPSTHQDTSIHQDTSTNKDADPKNQNNNANKTLDANDVIDKFFS